MVFFRPATPGFLVTLIATALLAVVSFGVPVIKSIFFLRAQIDINGQTGVATFGVLGYCLDSGAGPNCTSPKIGYEFDPNTLLDNTTPIKIPEVIVKWLTDALVLHIVALVLAAISALFGLLAHIREFATVYCSTFISGLAAAVALIAFIFDIAFFFLTKARINSIKGASAQTGNAIWLTLAAWLLLFFAGCFYTLGRCCTISRPRGPRIREPSNDVDFQRAEALRLDAVKAEADRKARHKPKEMGLPAFQEYDSSKPLTLDDDDSYHDGQISPRKASNFSSTGYFPQQAVPNLNYAPQQANPNYVPAPAGTSARDAYYASAAAATAAATTYPPQPQPQRQASIQQPAYHQTYASVGSGAGNANLYDSQFHTSQPSGHNQFATSHSQYATSGHEQYPSSGHNQYPSADHTQYPSGASDPYSQATQYPPANYGQYQSYDQYPANEAAGYAHAQYNSGTYPAAGTDNNSQRQYSTTPAPSYQDHPGYTGQPGAVSNSPSPTDHKLPPGIVPSQLMGRDDYSFTRKG